MLLIHCPYCGEERSELEFRWAGEAHIARPQAIAEISDAQFSEFFFLRDNTKGIAFERWRHIHGCGRFFNAIRDTVSDKFLRTYEAGLPRQPVPGAQPVPTAAADFADAAEGGEGGAA
ncbi:sarcosine oxidase subunit delta [Rhizobium sp. SSA_523]|uniref:sarcosine oxidase subunit delta n=1 Tax=Rhizobium sp. SSA_523 TaxID=2952477 RepID=UPI002091692D|nr:sarcosine oxidase subunit delta [Rhizobium sp. SSA_523]MCO5731852.1 sarcosine oxidase subunit delta [Rhizobium sp. SSA_523]WKC22786.1 sarcosine oxidase subunit delta [Rhizobium sp. SSA_523]